MFRDAEEWLENHSGAQPSFASERACRAGLLRCRSIVSHTMAVISWSFDDAAEWSKDHDAEEWSVTRAGCAGRWFRRGGGQR